MQKVNDGGPAFPLDPRHGMVMGSDGMSLRDYFAAKAMQGLLPNISDASPEDIDRCVHNILRTSYKIADAMLAAREVK